MNQQKPSLVVVPSADMIAPRRVLVTGAAGRIGRCLLAALENRFCLRAFDRERVENEAGTLACESIVGELSDLEALTRAMQGVDAVIHLAATKNEAPFVRDLVPNNVIGTYNVLEAARAAGVRRVVFASSAQTVAAYGPAQQLSSLDPPRPSSLYGASKVMGEVMGRYYFDCHGLEFVGVRVGWFLPPDDEKLRRRDSLARQIWLSPRDCAQLFTRALDAPIGPDFNGYAVVFGSSRTQNERLSLLEARRLGFEPQDDVCEIAVREIESVLAAA